MFKINTGEARTDLYGLGKGLAQVIDLSPIRNAAAAEEQRNFAEQQAKRKEQQAREDDLNNQMAAMSSVAIMPRDRQLIADKSKAVRDFTEQNIDKLRSGDAATQMQFQNLYGDLRTTAEMSKNSREDWEAVGQQIAKDPSKYRPEALEHYYNFAGSDQAGNFQFDKTQLKENKNYLDRVIGELANFAQKQAQDSPYHKTFTKQQAEQLITDDLTDAAVHDQAAYDLAHADKEELSMLAKSYGKPIVDPADYYKAKYAPKLVVNDTKAGPEWMSGGNRTKRPQVAAVVTNRKDGSATATINFTDKPDNPYLTIDNPDMPGQTMELRPMEITRDANGKVLLKASTKPHMKGDEEVPGKTITVDYNKVADVMNNTFGIDNPQELLKGKAPEHVTVKEYKVDNENSKGTQAEWNAKWAKLKKGESMVGLNGVTYTKK